MVTATKPGERNTLMPLASRNKNIQQHMEVEVNNNTWKMVQDRMGYTDREMELFKRDPRNAAVLAKASEIKNKIIVAEVMDSHGCISGHRVGDRFCLDGAGNLISALCPEKMCIYAVSCLQHLVFTIGEMVCAGIDPHEIKFKRSGCFDVGLECGGWGRVVMEVRVEDRHK
jgi:uncharacterized repeat protein (TIGR04076 family)